MAFNQLTDEQIDEEILRMTIEESMNINQNNIDDIDDTMRKIIEESIKEESIKEESVKTQNFENIIKENEKFLSETLNKFNKLKNIENTENIQNIQNTKPLTLEQLREKRLKKFAQVK
jgi:hypothetical protein